MKILALSDIHGRFDRIPLLADAVDGCEVIAVAGDITDFGGREQAEAVLTALCGFEIPVVGVHGNCDSHEVDISLQTRNGNIIDKPVIMEDVIFLGFKYHHPSAELSLQGLNQISMCERISKKMVIISHQPAWGTDVDLQASTRHSGSPAVRSFIEDYQPALAISGHIHEAYGIDRIGDTVLVNPGPFRNGRYAIIDLSTDPVKAELYWL